MQRTLALLFAASLALVILFPDPSFAQTRKRTTAKSTKSATPPPKTAEVARAGATRVADEIKRLTKFIYLLGGVAKGLEGVDDAAQAQRSFAGGDRTNSKK